MYRLVFLTGKLKGRRLAVQQGTLLIGRDPECQVNLSDDDEVSRNHAVIEQRADGLYVRDLGAMNPTEINGRTIKEWKLKHGDKIEVGRTVMQFQLIQAATTNMRRRSSPLQYATFAAMALLLAGQVAYLILFPIWQSHTAPAPFDHKRATAATSAEPAMPDAAALSTDALAAELEQAIAQAEKDRAVPAAVAATGTTSDAMFTEVDELRENLVDLRKQVESMTSAPPASAVAEPVAAEIAAPAEPMPLPAQTSIAEVAAAPAPEPEPAPAPAAPDVPAKPAVPEAPKEDALVAKARDMLTEALVEQQNHNLLKADALLERIQVMAPDFVPAYLERARLYESRGMLKKSGEQWTQVMNRTAGSTLYEQAAAERQRLARAEILQSMTKDTPGATAPSGARLPRRIRIASIEREKFEASRDYDEMRIVRVNLKARASEGDIDTDDFATVITFYDRGIKSDKVVTSQAVVPEKPVAVEGVWRAGEEKTVTAAYIVSKGFRVDEEEEVGERRAYEGVRIQIYYKDQLQDEEAVPKSLLALDSPPPPYDANVPVGR